MLVPDAIAEIRPPDGEKRPVHLLSSAAAEASSSGVTAVLLTYKPQGSLPVDTTDLGVPRDPRRTTRVSLMDRVWTGHRVGSTRRSLSSQEELSWRRPMRNSSRFTWNRRAHLHTGLHPPNQSRVRSLYRSGLPPLHDHPARQSLLQGTPPRSASPRQSLRSVPNKTVAPESLRHRAGSHHHTLPGARWPAPISRTPKRVQTLHVSHHFGPATGPRTQTRTHAAYTERSRGVRRFT